MFERFFGKKKKKDNIENEIEKLIEETEKLAEETEQTESYEDNQPDLPEENDTKETEEAVEASEPLTENDDEESEYDEKSAEADIFVSPQESEEVPITVASDESETKDEAVEISEEEIQNEENLKQGFFARLKQGLAKTRGAISEKIDNVFSSFKTIDDDLYDELEEALIMADIGAGTASYILDELRRLAKERNIKEANELKSVLKEIISDILEGTDNTINLSGSPAVIMIIGVNGVGKTTSIGKIAAMYQKMGKKVILAAADTFRAAAIDQLEIWAERAGVDIVKHQEGSDPSSVVFDAIASAKAKNADVVICDTAGRLHNKKPLMEELKKIARIIERESGNADFESLLVLDASTGQNALIQAREFASVAKITGVILTKLDGTAKGGVIIPLAKEQNIGVKFIGVGEQIDDLRPFEPKQFAEALFGDE